MNIGYAIRFCRQQRRFSLADLASLTGLSASYISLLERGKRKPTFETLEVLSDKLGIPVSVLVFVGSNPDELSGVSPDIHEKLSAATLKLLRATSDGSDVREQPTLL